LKQFLQKWNTYQKERFPLGIYSLLILTLTLAAASIAGNYYSIVEAFLMALGIFMLLRIADEFKDYEDDCKYRSYRAVPRGLITLKELAVLALFIVTIEGFLAYVTQTIFSFTFLFIYYLFMSKEFFMPKWLKRHPKVYLFSHMMIMPLIAFVILSAQGGFMSDKVTNFMALAFFNGLVLEVGRKIRQSDEEEEGVETYSFLWGKKRALRFWKITLFLSLLAFSSIVTHWILFLALLAFFIFLIFVAKKFNDSDELKAKKIETLSGVWLLLTYLTIFIDGVL